MLRHVLWPKFYFHCRHHMVVNRIIFVILIKFSLSTARGDEILYIVLIIHFLGVNHVILRKRKYLEIS